ncbi:MAG TPA: phosphotransferase family protein [Acidimicrobiales bacterium]|nr:phosphotransferase family protein [Acidimicrobiales bacterium]
MGDVHADELLGIARAALGDSTAVSDIQALTSGASRRSWVLQAGPEGGPSRRYVLQREMIRPDPATPADERPLPMTDQAALIEAAGAAGVPVARTVAAGCQGGLGWILAEYAAGEALPPRVLRDPDLAGGRDRLTDDAASALATLHRMDPARSGLADQDKLALYRRRLDQTGEERPVLELAYRWLVTHRPPARPAVIVHGDFRLGNLLVDRDGLRAVLDWELAHLGDPHEDVAWATIRAWRFDRHRPPGVFPEPDRWAAAYDRASGGRVLDPGALRWWQIAGTWFWAVISAMQARRHLEGMVRSLEHAVIGRRVCESEWDLLEQLP